MLGHIGTLDGKESASTDMQADILPFDTPGIYRLKDIVSEMQAGRRRRHGTPDPRIQSLVTLGIDGFGLTVEIWRDRYASAGLKHLREWFSVTPEEFHDSGPVFTLDEDSLQVHCLHGRIRLRIAQLKDITFPALGVSYHAFPLAGAYGCKRRIVLRRIDGFQAEDLDNST